MGFGSSTSNLSPLAPPFTVERSTLSRSGTIPLVEIADSNYSLNSTYKDWPTSNNTYFPLNASVSVRHPDSDPKLPSSEEYTLFSLSPATSGNVSAPPAYYGESTESSRCRSSFICSDVLSLGSDRSRNESLPSSVAPVSGDYPSAWSGLWGKAPIDWPSTVGDGRPSSKEDHPELGVYERESKLKSEDASKISVIMRKEMLENPQSDVESKSSVQGTYSPFTSANDYSSRVQSATRQGMKTYNKEISFIDEEKLVSSERNYDFLLNSNAFMKAGDGFLIKALETSSVQHSGGIGTRIGENNFSQKDDESLNLVEDSPCWIPRISPLYDATYPKHESLINPQPDVKQLTEASSLGKILALQDVDLASAAVKAEISKDEFAFGNPGEFSKKISPFAGVHNAVDAKAGSDSKLNQLLCEEQVVRARNSAEPASTSSCGHRLGDADPQRCVQSLVNALCNVSDVLVAHSSDLQEKERDVLSHVIKNLDACVRKNPERPVVDMDGKAVHSSDYDQQNSCAIVADKTAPDMMNQEIVTQAITKILAENFPFEGSASPEAVFYKNLWLEAEASQFYLTYTGRFNRLKMELEKNGKRTPQPESEATASNGAKTSTTTKDSEPMRCLSEAKFGGETTEFKVAGCPVLNNWVDGSGGRTEAKAVDLVDDGVVARYNVLRNRDRMLI